MEDEKAQRLVDTLSKLKKSAGLGISTHFNFGASSDMIQFKKDKDGRLSREDGLPVNSLYSGFVREGTYDPKISAERKYGDGRIIKRNFDDINDIGSDSDRENSSLVRNKKKKKKSKEERKAEKKAAKLEAKKAAKKAEKLEAKKREKIKARLLMKTTSKGDSDKINCSPSQEKVETIKDEKISKSKKEKKKQTLDSLGKNENLIEQNKDHTIRSSKHEDKEKNKKKKEKKEKKSKSQLQ